MKRRQAWRKLSGVFLAPKPKTSTPCSRGVIAAKSLEQASAAVPLLTRVIAQMSDEDGWVGLRGVGQRLANLASDFDPRTYGAAKLGDLVAKTGAFEIKRQQSGDMLIRPKSTAKPAAADTGNTGGDDGDGVARTTARRAGTRRRRTRSPAA